jgi:hypothetical protein
MSLHFPAFSEWVVQPVIMRLWVAVGIYTNTEIGCEILDWNDPAQNRDSSRAVVKKVMNLRL